MPFLAYKKLADIENTAAVSTGSCASMVQYYTRVGRTQLWVEGERVKGHTSIKKGTAIATFVNGIYPNKEHGNHAALYIDQDATGINVLDQWEGKTKITKRKLPFQGVNKDGSTFVDPSNNGDAFSIIEHE